MSDSAGASRRGRRVALTLLVLAILLLTAGLPLATPTLKAIQRGSAIGVATAVDPPSSLKNVTVTMSDQAPFFAPRFISVNVSSNLTVHLVNAGAYNHSFTLSKLSGVILSSTWSPAQLDSFFTQNGSLANVTVGPGKQSWVNLTFNTSAGGDVFEFVSIVPYQFQAGAWGNLNVTGGPGLRLNDSTTNSLSFVPSELTATPAKYPAIIDVLVSNTGSIGHTWTLVPVPNVTVNGNNYSSYLSAHPPLVSATVPTSGTVWANFSVNRPGVYQYVCTVSGHLLAGMQGFLYVGVPPPPTTSPPSTVVVQAGILIGASILLGLGLFLLLVASFTGRFPKKAEGPHHS